MTTMENNYFFMKRHISKHRAKQDVPVIFILLLILLQEIPIYLIKNVLKGSLKRALNTIYQHEES